MPKLTVWTAALLLLATHVGAAMGQEYVVAVAEENFRARPNGAKLGTLKKGATLAAVGERGRWVKGSLTGWIWKRSVQPLSGGAEISVAAPRENLRASPAAGGRLLGTVLRGTRLRKLGERGGWYRVAHEGWIWQPSLARGGPDDGAAAGPDATEVEDPAPAAPPADRTLAVEEENLRSAPKGRRIGRLRRGADLQVLRSEGSWLEVATRGFFWAASASGSGDSRRVAKAAENLRLAPRSEIVGVLERGTRLAVLGRAGAWLEVEVRGWMWEPSTLALGAPGGPSTGEAELPAAAPSGAPGPPVGGGDEASGEAVSAAAEPDRAGDPGAADTARGARASPPAGAEPVEPPDASSPPEDRHTPVGDGTGAAPAGDDERAVGENAGAAPAGAAGAGRRLTRSVPVKDGPDGALVAQALTGSRVLPIRGEGDWVKVRLEGWVPRNALAAGPAEDGVTVAMVLADPRAHRGAEVNWRLELISVARADGSPGDLERGEHYLLTRNAGGEREYVYVVIPEELVERVRDLPAFTPLSVRGIVRTGRSALVGNPIVELQELAEPPRRPSPTPPPSSGEG